MTSMLNKIFRNIIKTLKKLLKTPIKNIQSFIKIIAAKAGKGSRLYYTFFSNEFVREQHSVLQGIVGFMKNARSKEGSEFILRRNIHRLEKGLIMKNRRDIFAVDYINETIDCFEKMMLNYKTNPVSLEVLKPELCWAHEILNTYFAAVKENDVIRKAKEKYYSIPFIDKYEERGSIILKKGKNNIPPINYKSLLKLTKQRRAVRCYLPKMVPRNLLDKAVEVAVQSPSACNRQAFQFRIFDNPEMVCKIASITLGASEFVNNIPVIVVMVGFLSAYFSARDRHIIYIDGSLAAMAFMLALETLGLSSCPINWPDIENKEKRINRLLDLGPDERPILLLSVGYADPEGLISSPQKQPLAKMRRYN